MKRVPYKCRIQQYKKGIKWILEVICDLYGNSDLHYFRCFPEESLTQILNIDHNFQEKEHTQKILGYSNQCSAFQRKHALCGWRPWMPAFNHCGGVGVLKFLVVLSKNGWRHISNKGDAWRNANFPFNFTGSLLKYTRQWFWPTD